MEIRSKGKYNPEKMREVILVILNRCGAMEEEKLATLLYFIDADFYEKHGTSITGSTYIKT